MKTILILLLIGISVICQGQNTQPPNFDYKCSKCGSTMCIYKGLTTTKPLKLIYECGKCYNIDKFLPTEDKTTFQTFTQYPLYVAGSLTDLYSGDYNLKLATFQRGKFTICLDELKVTDTIWIQAGKRKVAIPAYKFLEYFKDEPSMGTIFWNGNKNIQP